MKPADQVMSSSKSYKLSLAKSQVQAGDGQVSSHLSGLHLFHSLECRTSRAPGHGQSVSEHMTTWFLPDP